MITLCDRYHHDVENGEVVCPIPDLGICNIATDSEGEQFTGKKVRARRARYVARRAALQRVGTRSAKRRLKQMRKRQSRYMLESKETL